jgi:transcription initiation factor TFIID subunit 5
MFSPNNNLFASGCIDGVVRLWKMNIRRPLRMFVGHGSAVEVLAFHPNGVYLGSGSSDKTIRIWNI